MMKHEFDNLVGITTDPDCYERIEQVYMNSEKFNSKQEIADFYKKHDMNGIEKLYKEMIEKNNRTAEFKEFIQDLAFFADGYVEEIKKHLADTANDIFQNKTLVLLLSEYRIRRSKEKVELAKKMMDYIQYENLREYGLSNNCLSNSDHYKTVLAGILVDGWWHEQNKGK